MSMTPLERFESRIDKTADCWLWTGGCNSPGYGQIWIGGRYRLSHRMSYELYVGAIPEGLVLDHLCRVRHCVNPTHLEPVTIAENNVRSAPYRLLAACHAGHDLTDPKNIYLFAAGRTCRPCTLKRLKVNRDKRKAKVAAGGAA